MASFLKPSQGYAFHPFGSDKLEMGATASVQETFDDNITYVKSGKKRDLITELLAGVTGKYESKRNYLKFLVDMKQQFFAEHSSFNNNAQDVKVDYEAELSKYDTIRINEKFSHYEEPRSFDEQFGREGGRYSYSKNNADLKYTREVGERVFISGSYGNEANLISRDDLRDSMVNRAGFDTGYLWNSALMFSVGYEFAHRYFESASFAGSDSAATHGVYGGIRRFITKTLYVDTKGGADFIRGFDNKNIAKPLFSASLNTELDPRTQVQIISFEKRTATTAFASNVFDYWRVSGGIARQLWKRLKGFFSAFIGGGRYSGIDREDNLYGVKAGLEYDFTDRLKLSADYTFSANDSNSVTNDFNKNTVSVKLSFSF